MALILVLSAALFAALTATANAGPPSGLTANGRDLWQFEALLNDTFHAKRISEHNLNFACAGPNCTPTAYWSAFLFTFAGAHGSSFHASTKTFRPGAFGNYPQPVRINGKLIACDTQEQRFLIAYADASGLGLDCLAPS
jgi:hypothetical protein